MQVNTFSPSRAYHQSIASTRFQGATKTEDRPYGLGATNSIEDDLTTLEHLSPNVRLAEPSMAERIQPYVNGVKHALGEMVNRYPNMTPSKENTPVPPVLNISRDTKGNITHFRAVIQLSSEPNTPHLVVSKIQIGPDTQGGGPTQGGGYIVDDYQEGLACWDIERHGTEPYTLYTISYGNKLTAPGYRIEFLKPPSALSLPQAHTAYQTSRNNSDYQYFSTDNSFHGDQGVEEDNTSRIARTEQVLVPLINHVEILVNQRQPG